MAEEHAAEYGHASDFSWVRGRLIYNPLEGGFWQVRFSTDPESPYGGRLTLGRDERLASFADGDAALIRGRISPRQASIFMSGTLYEMTSIERL